MKAIVCALCVGLMVPSFAGAAIENVQVTNNNFVAVTISWTTDSDVTGEVHYSGSPDLANALTAYDVRGQSVAGCTHYVEITGLTQETVYYFEVAAGGETDDNEGTYYTFTTTKQPGSPPTPCTVTGCVYEEDGSTFAVGSIVYLWVTHGGVASYPLSDLLSDEDATPGCFAFDLKQARSTQTNDLFPSIDPGDPLHLEVIDCGNYQVARDLVFDQCFTMVSSLTLDTTTSTTAVSVSTTTSAPGTTSSIPGTTSSIPGTTSSVPGTTSSVPGTTSSVPGTTSSVPGGGCATDEDCDDGVFCNGVETCDPEAGCQPGSDPCKENEQCREEDTACIPAMGIEATINGCGLPFFVRLGVVEIQGAGTDFTALSLVRYESPLVIKGLKLLNRNTQKVTQFVLLMPSIFFPAWEYPAEVPVTVGTVSGTLAIPACR